MMGIKLVDRAVLQQYIARDMALFMRILDQILTPEQITLLETELSASAAKRTYSRLVDIEVELQKLNLPEVQESYKTAIEDFAVKSGIKEPPPIKEEELIGDVET